MPWAPRGAGSVASPLSPRRVSASSPGAPEGPRSHSWTASADGLPGGRKQGVKRVAPNTVNE